MMSFWKDRTVFVTGVNGFLGPWLIQDLIKRGANVIGLVRDIVPNSNLYLLGLDKKIVTIRGSITDYQTMERILKEYEIKTCFHLAALATVPVANVAPRLAFEANIRGTWNVLEACRNSGLLDEVIIASSDKAYGIKEKLPYDESDPLIGRYPYDVSKSCADLIAQSYFYTYGLGVSVTRCGNFYGGGDLHYSRVIPGTIRSLFYNEAPIIRSDGTFKRDYIYVKDVANGYCRIAELLKGKKLGGEAFNLSTNNPISVIDLVNIIIRLFNSTIKPNILNDTRAEIKDQYLSSKKANDVLGWKPSYTLESGVAETIEWYKNYLQTNMSSI